MSEEKTRTMTTLEKVQLSLSFASPVLIFFFFIIIFIFLVKFDKDSFYPSYDLIKSNYSLLQEDKYEYNSNKPEMELLYLIDKKKDSIENKADVYNENLGIVKNKAMIDLRKIYNGYILKLNEISKNARHEKYLTKAEYQDVIELLPTENQMDKINKSLPKPFFVNFLKAVTMAVLLQVIIYNIIVQPLKLMKRNKSL